MAAVLAALVPVPQIAWVLAQDARSLLPGDAAVVVGLTVTMAVPYVVLAALAARWPRLGGLVVAAWALPRVLWFGDPHLEEWALWGLGALTSVGFVAAGWRWPGPGWALPAAVGAVLAAWPAGGIAPAVLPDRAVCDGVPQVVAEPSATTIVLVTLDTFRADHLGAIGGARFQAPTPYLDRLAERGTLFTEGVAPAPLTGPAHTALLTSCDPLALGVLRNGAAVPAAAPRVAEALRARGYRTGAFVAATVLDRRVGLDRGFDHYDDRYDVWHRLWGTWPRPLLGRLGWVRARRHRPGAQVVERALAWLDAQEGPTFLWVHLYDAHHPYDPEPEALDVVVDTDPGGQGSAEDVARWKDWARAHHRVRDLPGAGRSEVSERLRAYAGEVAEVDALVGRLLAAVPDDAAVLVAADHGESLTEHGYLLNHGAHAYQATLRVPYVAVGPGFAAGTRIDTPTPSQRVAGTLLRWAGLDGVDLGVPYDPATEGPIESLAAGQEARRRLRLARGGPELAVRDGSTKWLVRTEQAWRFDLDVDPEERSPVDVDGAALQERLRAIVEGGNPVAEGLEALGYID